MRLGVSRPIYVNVDSILYNFLGGYQCKKHPAQKLSSIRPFSGTSTHATHGVEAQFTPQPQLSPRCAFASLSRFSLLILISIMQMINVTEQCISQAGANINSACGPRGEGRTPLHIAAEHGHMVNAQVSIHTQNSAYIKINVSSTQSIHSF